DANGNFWLFGGAGYANDSSGARCLNDLWMFNVSDATWTWMSGNYSVNNLGTYGIKGVANETNVPGARYESASWTDANGNFWLFGGAGYDNVSTGWLNDLWMFNVSDATWTWVSGNYLAEDKGTYGTKGVADPANVPGARYASASWTDASGNFWLFGGHGYANTSSDGELNDLWMFNVSDATWTWMSGNYTMDNNGVYGTKGVAAAVNVPGARYASASWTDANGNFWLFGGHGYDNVSGSPGYLNDLWMFNVTTTTWTWVSGNYLRNTLGTYGTKGVADEANVPGARSGSVSYTDASDNLWLFGGYGYDNVSGSPGYLNDLWKYTP
ncbi:MAG: hypothetical protein EAX96_17985, partial [Candidatus Lokiarchaeota archaeon]|nr:hypothetical protein [Candidatus Lokiarchaeota archaeon]